MIEFAFVLIPFIPFIVSRFGRHWRGTVLFLMVFMVFEGAFRKWLLPGFQAQIYFFKDVILAFAFAGFMMERRLTGIHEPMMSGLRWVTLATMVYCFLQLVNPNSPSPVIWGIGFKSYFLYVALLFMVPYIFNSTEDLEKKLKIYMLIMLPVALLGLVQFAMPPDHAINRLVAHYEDQETFVSQFGEDNRARTSGTFSYIGGYATFISIMFAFSLAYLLAGVRSMRQSWVPLALLAATSLAMFTTGSRTVVLTALAVLPIMVLLALKLGMISTLTMLRVALGGGAIVLLVMFGGEAALEAYLFRTENSDDATMRMLTPFTEALTAFEVSPLFGTGMGTAHNSAAMYMRDPTMSWLHGNRFELETARVMQETGMIGFVLVYAPRVALIFVALKMATRLRTPLFKALSGAIAAYFMVQLFLFVINNPTGGLYFWFSAGLLFAMYRLENQHLEDYQAVPEQVRMRPAGVRLHRAS